MSFIDAWDRMIEKYCYVWFILTLLLFIWSVFYLYRYFVKTKKNSTTIYHEIEKQSGNKMVQD